MKNEIAQEKVRNFEEFQPRIRYSNNDGVARGHSFDAPSYNNYLY